ncbi:MAG: hypothetical protein H0W81_12845, partial [Chloroflexi bacterium]|nr:hypothetical protein [Chloroflexota bacterium]
MTLLTLSLLPALMVPLLFVAAAEPAVQVHGDMHPGGVVDVTGTKFGNNDTVDFLWDSAPVGWLPSTQSAAQGTFVLATTLPSSTAVGSHELTAVQMHLAGEQLQERGRVAIVVEVASVPPELVPTAPPTAAPTVASTPVPTAAATPVPAVPATPAPSAASKVVANVAPAPPTAPAAPPVAGYGAGTTGGSGGTVYLVSSWAQLKAALLASGSRIVRLTGSADFDGGGERLTIGYGNLTIDGSGWSGSLRRYSIVIAASNVIVTQLRLRPGDQMADAVDRSGLTINPGIGGSLSHVVIDHSSLLWGPDVTLAILNNTSDVTVQYSILGAGLRYSANPSSPNGYGPNVTTIGANSNPGSEYGRRITFYRNYIADNWARNLRAIGTDGIEWVNNVVYNWGEQLSALNPRGANVVGNMFKPGPNTTASRITSDATSAAYPTLFANSVYWADNLGLGFTPKLEFGAGVQRSSPY